MKKLISGISILALCITPWIGKAQNKISDATITYNISVKAQENKPAVSQSLEGAKMIIYLKGSDSRTEMVNNLGSESTIYLGKAGKGYILKEYSGQKLMITLTRENWMRKNQVYSGLDFKIENTTEVINGYNVKKATSSAPGGKKFTVYFATDYNLQNKEYNHAFPQLPGLPVQYEIESGEIIFKYTLTGISTDPVPAAKLEIPKSGFRVMTYEENLQLKKGVPKK